MNGCRESDPVLEHGKAVDRGPAGWREHLAGCAVCRQQARVDALLRAAVAAPAPVLADGFEDRLRSRLERGGPERPAAAGRPRSLRPAGWWAIAAYGTAAAMASAVILARLPWQSFTPSPAVGVTLGLLALLSPLVLLDRIGLVRPPG